MSYETKRNVFGQLLNTYQNLLIKDAEIHEESHYDALYENITTPWNVVYDAALPDDLPVIPKEVSDRLKQAKADKSSLRYMFACSSINMLSDWWMAKNTKNEDVFARAWVLGVWRVEETGEIVKLEADK